LLLRSVVRIDCPHRSDRFFKRCRCRKWITLLGAHLRAGTRCWEVAQRKARILAEKSNATDMPVAEAVRLFIEDQEQQGHSKNWQYKHRRELNQFAEFCAAQAMRMTSDVTLQHVEEFRKTWSDGGTTRKKRQERIRQFFRYCLKHDWCSRNVAADLSKIKVHPTATLPLTREQFAAALAAAAKYHPLGKDREWHRRRAVAMLLLCRHSGLRISDAARLERSRLQTDDSLLLRTSKTGQPVYVLLPAHVAKLLRDLENPDNRKYFFWNGTSAWESPGIRWWGTLKRIFKAAGIPEAHPHCLRDTFAIECLLGGMELKEVSVLLGHSSIAITERHYLPWVRARQVRLEESLKKVWAERGLQEEAALVNASSKESTMMQSIKAVQASEPSKSRKRPRSSQTDNRPCEELQPNTDRRSRAVEGSRRPR